MRIFDCVLYNGEIEVLLLRLHELHEVVDVFVIVEAGRTFSGRSKELRLQAQWKQVRSFARKIRYVVIADDIEQGGPWDESASREIALGVDCSMPWMETLFAPPMWTKSPRRKSFTNEECPSKARWLQAGVLIFLSEYRNVAGRRQIWRGAVRFPDKPWSATHQSTFVMAFGMVRSRPSKSRTPAGIFHT